MYSKSMISSLNDVFQFYGYKIKKYSWIKRNIFLTDKMVCSRHADKLCGCESSKRVLLYRYSASYLQDLLEELQYGVDVYTRWSTEVTDALKANSDSTKLGNLRYFFAQWWYISDISTSFSPLRDYGVGVWLIKLPRRVWGRADLTSADPLVVLSGCLPTGKHMLFLKCKHRCIEPRPLTFEV